jgi:hypothetical protein
VIDSSGWLNVRAPLAALLRTTVRPFCCSVYGLNVSLAPSDSVGRNPARARLTAASALTTAASATRARSLRDKARRTTSASVISSARLERGATTASSVSAKANGFHMVADSVSTPQSGAPF